MRHAVKTDPGTDGCEPLPPGPRGQRRLRVLRALHEYDVRSVVLSPRDLLDDRLRPSAATTVEPGQHGLSCTPNSLPPLYLGGYLAPCSTVRSCLPVAAVKRLFDQHRDRFQGRKQSAARTDPALTGAAWRC